jgi:hypothetical protein
MMKQVVPNFTKGNQVFVTDREQAFQNVITDMFPTAPLLMCWSHIRRDIVFWVRKQGAKSDDIAVYTTALVD